MGLILKTLIKHGENNLSKADSKKAEKIGKEIAKMLTPSKKGWVKSGYKHRSILGSHK